MAARAQADTRAHAPLVVFHAPADVPQVADAAVRARTALEGVAAQQGTALVDLSPAPRPRSRAAELLRQAIDAYHGFRHDHARTRLVRVLDEARQTGAHGLTAGELGDAHIYMGLVATERGDATLAWDSFVHAATIDPTRHLDPVRMPPRVVDSFERAVAAVTRAQPTALRIDVEPGCAVHLDGRPVRPADEQSVVPGHHYLDVRCPGHAAYGALVVIAGPRALLRPGLATLALPDVDDLRTLARDRGARALLAAVVAASPGVAPTLSLRLLDVDSGRERGRALVRLGGAGSEDRVRRAAERLLSPNETNGPNGPDGPGGLRPLVAMPLRASRAEPAPRWYRRPWVWGAAGALLSAAVLLPFLGDDGPRGGFGVSLGGDLPP